MGGQLVWCRFLPDSGVDVGDSVFGVGRPPVGHAFMWNGCCPFGFGYWFWVVPAVLVEHVWHCVSDNLGVREWLLVPASPQFSHACPEWPGSGIVAWCLVHLAGCVHVVELLRVFHGVVDRGGDNVWVGLVELTDSIEKLAGDAGVCDQRWLEVGAFDNGGCAGVLFCPEVVE